MIIETPFISQFEAEHYNISPKSNCVIISITGTDSEDAILDKNWKKILRLKFDDIVQDELLNKIRKKVYRGITIDQAKQIKTFVEELLADNTPWQCFVHCYAGVSRSAAVSKYISQKANLDFPEDYIVYNPKVFKTLVNLE